jgi:hypothetical protein
MRLAEFLDAQAARPFSWADQNCLLFCADWVLACTGVDPAEEWRGRCGDEQAAYRAVRAAGGFTRIMDAGLARAGWRRALSPAEGSIGLIRAPRLTGAIRTRRGWAFRSDAGITVADLRSIAAWERG